MRTMLSVLILSLVASTPVFAADKPATEQSIRRLMTATESKKLVDNALASVDSSIESGMKNALGGRQVDAKVQAILDDSRAKLSAIIKDALSWQDLEPRMIEVYQRSLSEDEVKGMIAFYESKAGQAVVRKMPLIQQNLMQLMQERMKTIMPKIIQVQQDAIAQVKASTSGQ